ncbi:gastrula zinc finger protein XlCGF8.2DB-like isoform X1 [Nerophis ophidion]|uniref:gastrula zinc finger protein XlCGF8.2DB-like isoform X1 n=1 Tax=Nerophis ophidion TaxID=159077 RepID=UPI002AE0127C|nr:gastrula zinc finger protein XlCGF8.2DB-like isoform X1 [Nerophis ophidion]
MCEVTTAEYKEELSSKEETERQHQLLDAVFKKQEVVLHGTDTEQQEDRPSAPRGEISTLKQEYPQPSNIKEEEEERWISQSGEERLLGPQKPELTKLPLTGVSVKTDLSNSDDIMSQSENEDENDAKEPLSSDTDCEGHIRTHTDNKHPECSEKKTRKTGFTCSFCAKMFCKKSNYARHIRTHTQEKPFKCSVCCSSFSQKVTLTIHMRTHTGEKPFCCSACGDTFSRKDCLKLHMRTHTGEKPFSCLVCSKKFSFKDTLTGHMRTHTGEKPFSCSVCCDTFTCKSTLTKHMRTHTGEKPYICSVCGDTFSRGDRLKLHMRKHTGEKPYICSVCDKAYSKKQSLTGHMLAHNRE